MSMTSAVLDLPRHAPTEPDDDRFEVIEGQILERNMGSWAGVVEGKLFFLLYTFSIGGPIGRPFSSAVLDPLAQRPHPQTRRILRPGRSSARRSDA